MTYAYILKACAIFETVDKEKKPMTGIIAKQYCTGVTLEDMREKYDVEGPPSLKVCSLP